MMYGLVIDGRDVEQRRAALAAAIETLRKDLLATDLDHGTRRFFNQGKLLLTLGEPRKDLVEKIDRPQVSA